MVRQVSSYLLANIVSAVFGFASVVIFTRLLGPAEYGIYVVGFSIAAMISALTFGWIKSSVVPFSADGNDTDLRLTMGLAFPALLLLIPVLYFGISAFAPQSLPYLLPAILLAFGIGFFEFYLEIFRAKQDTMSYMWATILRAASALGVALLLVLFFDLGGTGLLASVAISYFLVALVYSVSIWRHPVKPFDPKLLRAILAFGLPMTVSGTVFVAQAMLDRFVLAGQMGEHAAGIYGASADLVRQIILFPGVAIGSAVAPIAAMLLAQNDRPALDRHLVDSTELLLGILAPAAMGLAIIAAKLGNLVLGEEFRADAAIIIPIIALAWVLRSMSYQVLHVSFQIRKTPGLMLGQGVAILAINAVALFVLVPRFGLAGAAAALVISEAAGVVIGCALTRWSYPVPLEAKPFFKVGLATAAMAIPTFLVDRAFSGTGIFDIALPVVTGILAYGLAGYVLDVASMRSRFRAVRLRQEIISANR